MNFINSINTLSLGIFCSLLFAACLIYPLYVLDLLPPIAWFKWFLLIFAAYFTIKRYSEEDQSGISAKTIALGLFLFSPLIIANLCYDRVQISHHGWYHNAYVLQILQDIYPIKNVNAPGIALTTYWSFHYLIAVFSETFNCPSFRVNAIFNCFSLWIIFSVTGKILRQLNVKSSPLWCFILILIVLFNGNLFGSLFYAFNVLTYDLNLYVFDIPWQSEIRLIPGTPVADYFILQLSTIYSKFFNYSGVPLGIAGFLFSLYNMMLFRKK